MSQSSQQLSSDMRELYTIWVVSEICKDPEKLEMAEQKEKKFETYSKLYDKVPAPAYPLLLLTAPTLVVTAALGAVGTLPIYVPIAYASALASLFGFSAFFGDKESKKDKVLEISYQQAYPKAIHVHPPDVHQVFTLLEKDLQQIGIISGYDFRDPNIYGAFSKELEELLRAKSDPFGLGSGVFKFYENSEADTSSIPDYLVGPNLNRITGILPRFLRSVRKFEEEFMKIAGKDGLNLISQRVVEYSSLSQKELYGKAREIRS